MRTHHFIAIVILLSFGGVISADQPSVMQRMTTKGIQLTEDVTHVLPAPSVDLKMDAETRKANLEKLTRGRGWTQFARKSTNAPVTINLKYIQSPSGERIGHQIHFAFVVHATLETLKDKDLMKSMASEEEKPEDADLYKMDEISVEKLKEFGTTPAKNNSYGFVQSPLMNRVIIRGTIRTEQVISDDSVLVTWEMDPRFTNAKEFANTWSSIKRDRLGKKVQSDPKPYQGAGGYMHVSKLPEVDGAVLVESQMVIHEPTDWFSSSTALRSKMPLLIQNTARDFRRKLAKK